MSALVHCCPLVRPVIYFSVVQAPFSVVQLDKDVLMAYGYMFSARYI